MISKQAAQGVAKIISCYRGDQDDFLAGAGCQQCSKARAAWPTPLPRDVDHRHRRFGTQPAGLPFNVDVQHRVTEDNQRTAAGGRGHRSPTCKALSSAMHNACTKLRWISCTVATVGASTATAESDSAARGLGAGPVIAQTVTPRSRPALAAAITFGLVPLAESATSTSPRRPYACTCRANSS